MAKSHAVADFGERTVGKWINAVTAYSDFLPLESRLQLSFERFGLSCAEPLNARRSHPLLAPDLLDRSGGASPGLNPAAVAM
jgi:hypothetical protein